ncbi:MAG: ribosome small subunit-dependent GTPase A [Ignavibacteriales bacterium]|nr:ribosome small subunit-dependent GTPase A [Ignavibacteriales bacterium]WKZ73043.1 MAG: ribosome small subunit-dependent GTPase A [Ignavibacteriaceae bacterium]
MVKIEGQSHWVLIEQENRMVRCVLRGKFKHELKLKKGKLLNTDIAVVGDTVEFDMADEREGVIHTVYPRKNFISRKAPRIKGSSVRGERLEQVIAANIDRLFIVASFGIPEFNNRVIDRFIVVAESSDIHPVLIFNKIDLAISEEEIEFWDKLYTGLGYKIYKTSALTGEGFEELKNDVRGVKSMFWGHSGVGKSSVLNALYPKLNLATGLISNYSRKGRHTTVIVNMNRIDDTTFLIDTPGIREVAPFGIKKEDLGHYFVEFVDYLQECKYKPCTHHHEPGCAVIDAVENEKISSERYESYLRLLENIEDDMIF